MNGTIPDQRPARSRPSSLARLPRTWAMSQTWATSQQHRIAILLAFVVLMGLLAPFSLPYAAAASPVSLDHPPAPLSDSPAPSGNPLDRPDNVPGPPNNPLDSSLMQPLLLAGRPGEANLGQELHQEILAEAAYGPPVDHPRAQAVFARLVPVVNAVRDNVTYTLTVFAAHEPSAFALPGGFVYVTAGLVDALDDAQLAGVLAHELVHTVYSHSLQQMSLMASLEQITAALVSGGTAGDGMGEIRRLLADVGRWLLSLGYSRSQEAEADRVGQQWAFAAGFDPMGLPRALRILDDSPQPGGVAPYLSSHPATAQRVAALEDAASQLLADPGFRETSAVAAPPPASYSRSSNRLVALAALVLAVLAQSLHA